MLQTHPAELALNTLSGRGTMTLSVPGQKNRLVLRQRLLQGSRLGKRQPARQNFAVPSRQRKMPAVLRKQQKGQE